MGKTKEKLRLNFREAWFFNLGEVTTNGETEVTFHLKRPQPAFLSLLASGYSPTAAMSRHATSARIRSAPAPSNL